MRGRLILLAVAWLALPSCARRPEPGGEPATAPSAAPAVSAPSDAGKRGDCDGLFQPPVGADPLCDEHDLATDAEVHWRSFGIRDARATVEARYRALAQKCGASVVDEPTGLLVTQGPWHLSTHDVRAGEFPSCERSASPEHQAVVLISSMFRR